MHARMHGHGHGTARIEACSQQPTAASSSQPADPSNPVDPDQGTRTRTIVLVEFPIQPADSILAQVVDAL
jgi:hypothetical protein